MEFRQEARTFLDKVVPERVGGRSEHLVGTADDIPVAPDGQALHIEEHEPAAFSSAETV